MDPYRVIDQIDPNTGDNVVRIRRVGAPAATFSVLLGDCLFNLRSCLDHLVYLLAFRHHANSTREPWTYGEITDTQFPIFKQSKDFRTKGEGYIRRIHPDAQAIIERLQPYNAPDPEQHWLWLLNHLHNVDKHRTPNVSLTLQTGVGISPAPNTLIEYPHWTRSLRIHENEAEVCRYKAVSMVDRSARVKVNFTPAATVGFAYPPVEGREVILTLSGIRDFIERDVLVVLRPFA